MSYRDQRKIDSDEKTIQPVATARTVTKHDQLYPRMRSYIQRQHKLPENLKFTQYESNFKQERPANAKGTRDSSACMKAHCEQM